MGSVLVVLAVTVAVALPALLWARKRIAERQRPPRYKHLTDEQWQTRRAVLLARRASNRLREPALTDERRVSDRPFGRLYRNDDGEHAHG